MAGTPWQPFAAALAAPLAIWILWRIQTSTVELLRLALHMLGEGHRIVYHVVSWFGTLLHELSHATVLLLSGHGISEFRVGSERGHVLPARMSKGPIGFLFFLLAALAPLFVPPVLVLLGLWWVDPSVFVLRDVGPGLAGSADLVRILFVDLPTRIGSAVLGLRAADWRHVLLFLLVLLAIPGARPSHVKGSRFHGTQDEGDVAVLRAAVRRNPWPLLVFLLLLYGAFLGLVAFTPWPATSAWYWIPMEFVCALGVTGALLALFGTLWWGAAGLSGRSGRWPSWLCLAAFVGLEAFGSLVGWTPAVVNLVAFGAWLAVGLLVRVMFRPKRMPF